jgi:signal transduction histidine kinase
MTEAFRTPEATDEGEEGSGTGEALPLRILVVDDDVVDRTAVRRGLRSAGIQAEFQEAEDVSSAVALLRTGPFDCAFLDFRLPGGDGLQVLREVRRAGVRTPIVMLTGQGDEQLAVELMKAGASDYLPKGSASAERLAQSLRYALRVHRAEMQARAAEAAREEAIAARSRFYATMSHELRTPINAIIGYNDLLLSSIYGPLSEPQSRGLERAQKAARHLLELVNDVLDLAKIEAGKMPVHLERVDIDLLIREISLTIEPMVRRKKLEYRLSLEPNLPVLETDRTKVKQILLNLLSNAAKFTHKGYIELSARRAPRADGGVELAVRDTGIGIRPEDMDKIFEDFRQVDQSSTREYGGTGLGLSITKKLLTLLGGTIRVDSCPGEGSTFTVWLPPKSPAAPPAEAPPAEPDSG